MKITSIAILLGLFFSTFTFACDVIDDAGKKIKLNKPAQRIISLAPDITEVLFAAGAGDQIVGVMQGSNYPAKAKKIPVVASFNGVDIEKILSLHPDLIIVWAEGNLAQQLKKIHVPIFTSHQKKLTDIPSTLYRFGCLAGTEKVANQVAQEFERHYLALQEKYSQRKSISVFYQVWPQPLMTITQESWINDVITLCGGKNIFATLKGAAPEVSLEAVIMADPQIIIGTQSKQDWKKIWNQWPQLQSVKKNHLVAIHPDVIERASPRILEGTQEICQALEQVRKTK